MDAVRHARKYLTSMDDVPWEEVQHALALLAFPADTRKSFYSNFLNTNSYLLFFSRGFSLQRTTRYFPMDRSNWRIPSRLLPSLSIGSFVCLGSCFASWTICHENSVSFPLAYFVALLIIVFISITLQSVLSADCPKECRMPCVPRTFK